MGQPRLGPFGLLWGHSIFWALRPICGARLPACLFGPISEALFGSQITRCLNATMEHALRAIAIFAVTNWPLANFSLAMKQLATLGKQAMRVSCARAGRAMTMTSTKHHEKVKIGERAPPSGSQGPK